MTDTRTPRRLGPKRVGKIVKMFNLSKDDDVRDFVVRRKVKTKNGNKMTKKPKIQRLITPGVKLRRKQIKKKLKRRKDASYAKRKAYFDRLTQKGKQIKESKKQAQKAVNKKSKQDKQQKKGGKSGSKKGGRR